MPEVIVLPDRAELAAAAAQALVVEIEHAIERQGHFTVALSGGTTPEGLFRRLAEPVCADRIDWERVRVFWGDERTVPPDAPASNYGMAKRALLDRVPIPAGNIFRLRGERPPDEAAREYEDALKDAFKPPQPGQWPTSTFDLTLLGLGSDGHTASLFPGTRALEERQRWVVANFVQVLQSWRLTLTLPAINLSSQVWFLVAGADKASSVARALSRSGEQDPLPVQLVKPASGHLRWFLDEEAASMLPAGA